MTELILTRHGVTDWNRELRFQGQVDVPLNATGHEQARRLARRLAEEAVVADHLVSSDLVRTRQTAAPVLGALLPQLHIDALTDPGLREQDFGLVDGMRVQDIKDQHPEAWAQWLRFQAACPAARPRASSTRASWPRCTAWRSSTPVRRWWW